MEISPEVETWYATLNSKDKAMADRAFDRLAEHGPALRMPHARPLGGGSLPTLNMLARLAHATGTPLRLAAPGITGVDLGGAA